MLFATILFAGHMLLSLFGPTNAATVTPDACKCLDSIVLPGFQSTFYVRLSLDLVTRRTGE